jgi:hypothetical protein
MQPGLIRDNHYVAMNTLTARLQSERAVKIRNYIRSTRTENNVNASGHLDTRNWQSVSAKVSFIKIPLQPGENEIILSYSGSKTITFKINGAGNMQMKRFTMLD